MANTCSTLNPDCLAKKGTPCPALEQNKNCWEYDWVALIEELPAEEQDKWKRYLADQCPRCPAFCPEMKPLLARLQVKV